MGEEYLGITVYRFYFKCPQCSAELVMKTDPKNSDYTVEAGASRNYEPWRDADAQARPRTGRSLPHPSDAAFLLCAGGGCAEAAGGGGGGGRDESAREPHTGQQARG